jgi:putative NADH-flavin reductase
MKLVVFGASGKTGILLVYQALEKGHEVTAFARKPESVTIRHDRLRVLQGDILQYDRVRTAVEGSEVVLSTLGVYSRKPTTALSEGTANIARAMKECGVKRLICMSSAGVLGNDAGFLFDKILIPMFLNEEFKDKKRQLQVIRGSGLEWVVIRPSSLTDSPKTGKYQITAGPPAYKKVPRADVADFMLRLLTDRKYDQQTPAIAGY